MKGMMPFLVGRWVGGRWIGSTYLNYSSYMECGAYVGEIFCLNIRGLKVFTCSVYLIVFKGCEVLIRAFPPLHFSPFHLTVGIFVFLCVKCCVFKSLFTGWKSFSVFLMFQLNYFPRFFTVFSFGYEDSITNHGQ